jgi:prepilin-type N-terminal cleavage/methylation domain-containing protein
MRKEVNRHSRLQAESGFTLIEVLVASLILLIGVLGTVTIFQTAARANTATRQRDAATNLARDVIEAIRTVPYDRLTDPGVLGQLQDLPGLASTTAGTYTVKRGATLYTVSVDICVMDDPRDGGGPRSGAANICAGSAPAGTQDRNPEDYKKVTPTITWRTGSGLTRTIVQTGIVSNPGSASGPAIRSIAPRGFAAPYVVTNQLATSVIVDLTTSSRPEAVNWLLDGTVQQTPPVATGTSGLAWVFTWTIGNVDTGVLDGDYILSAEAFNQYGVSGPGRQETVILNRRNPFKPRQVVGGRTPFGTVEIEWTANSERDIAGYEVYREGSTSPVCPLAAQRLDTICVDTSPPNAPNVNYWVYAYDKNPVTSLPRIGDQSDTLRVVADNLPPYAPTALSATRAPDASVTLQWNRPAPQDPDSGDAVEFYRIYRDGKALTDRYARWFDPAASVTWQDTATEGTTHTYWVTAVDRRYAESPYLGPVTL